MTAVRTVDVPCSNCGATVGEPLWAGREHEYDNTTDEEFQFVRCPSCGLVRLNPRPDVAELGRIYPPDYYAYNLLSEDGDRPRRLTDSLKMRMYQQRFVDYVSRIQKPDRLKILDVGCADGRLLDWYRESPAGPRLETHGIEMDERAASTARGRGHRVIAGRFEVDRELEANSFDLILAFHVIEHVDDPVAFARRASELLAPGGLLIIATPNWDSADARRLQGDWGGNHFPRHWTLYDERSISDLAGGVGLSVERVEFQPNPIFWVWSCHSWLRRRYPHHRWPDRVFPPVAIFDASSWSFVLQTAFSVLDLALRRFTGRTASMAVELRKPYASPPPQGT